MTTLVDLVAELELDVPAVNGVPSDAQYEQAVKDAAIDFSRRCGLVKISTLTIVSGTATYNLPDDFLKLISMDSLVGVDGVIISNGGLIPISKDFEEEWTIANKQITFHPTPAYSLTRYFKYKSAWVMDEEEDYTTMGEDEAQIVLLKAKANAFEKVSNSGAGDGFKYSVGNMSVDKSGVSDGYSKRSDTLHNEFLKGCEAYNGAVLL